MPAPVGLQGGGAGEGAQQQTAPLLQHGPHRRILELQEQGGGLDGVWRGGEGKEEVEVVVVSEGKGVCDRERAWLFLAWLAVIARDG